MRSLNARFRAIAMSSLWAALSGLLMVTPILYPQAVPAAQSRDYNLKHHGVVVNTLKVPGGSYAIALQDDGKIVAAGYAGDSEYTVLRYKSDRSLDRSFGPGGLVTDQSGYSVGVARGVAIQPDGKIVAAGSESTGAFPDPGGHSTISMVVARYTPEGALDPGFGQGGYTILNPSLLDGATCLALQPDGKIVVGGDDITAPDLPGYGDSFTVARLNQDGSLDASFGNGGSVITSLGVDAELRALKLQTDGKIVAAGCMKKRSVFHFAVVRYNSDGTLDPSFGSGGIAVTNRIREGFIRSLAIQADGKLVVTGSVGGQIAIARYDPDGTLDTSFGAGGVSLASAGEGRSVALLSDGRIMIGGSVFNGQEDHEFVLLRFRADGSPDSKFGENGAVVVSVGHLGEGEALAIGQGGRILLGGYIQENSQSSASKFAIVEYRP